MRNYADQDYLHARIYALRSRLLSSRDYASMVREPPDAFKSTGDLDWIESREALFREQIKPVLKLVETCVEYVPIFLAYLRQYEIQNVMILLARAAGLAHTEHWYDIGPFAILKKEMLRQNLTIGDIRLMTANTYLAEALRDESGLPHLEIHLDVCRFRNFYSASDLLSDGSRKDFQEVLLKRVAMVTVIRSYRLREYCRAGDEMIRLSSEKLHAVWGVDVKRRVRLLEAALNQYVDKLRKSGAEEPSPVDIERHLEQNYYQWLSSMFHRDFHSIFTVMAYLWLLHCQIKNMMRILDGGHFGLSAEAILHTIICAE